MGAVAVYAAREKKMNAHWRVRTQMALSQATSGSGYLWLKLSLAQAGSASGAPRIVTSIPLALACELCHCHCHRHRHWQHQPAAHLIHPLTIMIRCQRLHHYQLEAAPSFTSLYRHAVTVSDEPQATSRLRVTAAVSVSLR